MSRVFSIFLILLSPVILFSQQRPEERLVRLLDAKSAETKQIDGKDFRKITGPAQFLHNDALILCDSAIWDVTLNTVNALGNVRIIQNQTTLSSDQITYIADRNVAEVRGRLVELIDKDSNKVRTHFLDYFTKDSLAMFYNGVSMFGKDSNYIESLNGFYYGKEGRFMFQTNVQMLSDSIIMKADTLEYLNTEDRVIFSSKTHSWQGGNYLTARGGWYDRKREFFHFIKDVYIKTSKNEIWTDTLDYNRRASEAELSGNIQILDTANSSYIFADHATYTENPFKVVLTRHPGGASFTIEEGVADTLFFAADSIVYYTLAKNAIDSATISASKARYELSKKDPVSEQYSKPPLAGSDINIKRPGITPKPAGIVKDSLSLKRDSLPIPIHKPASLPEPDTLHAPYDSTLLQTDSLILQNDTASLKPDTTAIKFILANKNIRFFKSDIRGICDSLTFNSLDSLIRLFKDPVVWNEQTQITSDSMQVVISDGRIKKAEFTSSSFVVTPHDSTHYNQIKSTDMIALFDKGKLRRFDALGGVSTLFFLEEDSVLTTMNEKECKIMTARLADQKVERIKYIDNIRNNGYPVFELKPEQEKLKGFRWLPELKLQSRFDVTKRVMRASEAEKIMNIELPLFPLREVYFKETVKKAEPESGLPDNTEPENNETRLETVKKATEALPDIQR
jgi:lipopolysaccharide export system protein LptA